MDSNDWLIAGCETKSNISIVKSPDGSVNYTLANGIVSRTMFFNASSGLLATTSIKILGGAGKGELLRGVSPETMFVINDVLVVVGGTYGHESPVDDRLRAKFLAFRDSGAIRAGGFHFVPGSRGSFQNASW